MLIALLWRTDSQGALMDNAAVMEASLALFLDLYKDCILQFQPHVACMQISCWLYIEGGQRESQLPAAR